MQEYGKGGGRKYEIKERKGIRQEKHRINEGRESSRKGKRQRPSRINNGTRKGKNKKEGNAI